MSGASTRKKPRRSEDDKIAQAKAHLQALERKKMARRKAKDTRRKILLGEIILRHFEAEPSDAAFSQMFLDHLREALPALLRKADDGLFDALLQDWSRRLSAPSEQTRIAAASAPAGAEAVATRNPTAGFDSDPPAALTES